MKNREDLAPSYSDQGLFNAFEKPKILKNDAPLKIVFIGNSLTLHGPAAAIGWDHNHGMAASAPAFDYVHQVIRKLSLKQDEASFENFSDLERSPIDARDAGHRLRDIQINSNSIVVLQLGDNVSTNQELQVLCDNLCKIIPIFKEKTRRVMLVSTWWESPPKDQLLQKLCELFKVRYVFIGDLFKSESNRDRASRRHGHEGVNNHPGDWGMAQIAKRIQTAIEAEDAAS